MAADRCRTVLSFVVRADVYRSGGREHPSDWANRQVAAPCQATTAKPRVQLASCHPNRYRAHRFVLEEVLAGSVTYRNYRAPGQRSSWRKEAVSGAIAVSSRRLVVWAGRGKHIDVPLVGPFLATIDIAVEAPDRVRFAYDAGRFSPDRSGTVEVRLRIPHAARVADLLSTPT